MKTISQKHAREIIGKNLFGIEEAVRHFGVNPSKQQLAALAEVPFTEETLDECKHTHVLVAMFPLSILDIRGQKTSLFNYKSRYNEELFAKDSGNVSWQLIRKTWAPNSNLPWKTFDEQQALLAKNEKTPTARAMVYTIIGHFLASGERLFENHVRCSGSYGCSVDIGFGSNVLDISIYWGIGFGYSIGMASARKHDRTLNI